MAWAKIIRQKLVIIILNSSININFKVKPKPVIPIKKRPIITPASKNSTTSDDLVSSDDDFKIDSNSTGSNNNRSKKNLVNGETNNDKNQDCLCICFVPYSISSRRKQAVSYLNILHAIEVK